jgi:hypothetical protein
VLAIRGRRGAVADKATASEALIACNILNAMTTLGTPESFAIGT